MSLDHIAVQKLLVVRPRVNANVKRNLKNSVVASAKPRSAPESSKKLRKRRHWRNESCEKWAGVWPALLGPRLVVAIDVQAAAILFVMATWGCTKV